MVAGFPEWASQESLDAGYIAFYGLVSELREPPFLFIHYEQLSKVGPYSDSHLTYGMSED